MLLVGIWDKMLSQGHHYCHWPRLDKSSMNAWFGLGYPREILGGSLAAVSADVAAATRAKAGCIWISKPLEGIGSWIVHLTHPYQLSIWFAVVEIYSHFGVMVIIWVICQHHNNKIDTIQKMKFGGYQDWQKSRLPKHPPPRFLYIKMPSSLVLLLFYSDCCVNTCYPDNFGSLVPLINHIMLRLMQYSSFAHRMSV